MSKGTFQHGYFNGKKISGCEVLSFDEELGLGLANFRGCWSSSRGVRWEWIASATSTRNSRSRSTPTT